MNIRKKVKSITSTAAVSSLALLLSIPVVQASSDGETLYMQHCSVCHQPDGQGIPSLFPPLAANLQMSSDDPETIQEYLRLVIFGYHGGLIVNNQVYSGKMPPIGEVGRLNDSELLELINYQRSSWGNNGRAVTFTELATAREAGRLKPGSK
ncbi:cytochrome c [Pseudomonas sp. C27(2019)]|uniref:c-type cytochrome n=1 Tax=Pseudomonas sp. C27(2019) TaxID=2604941 RepID=UPI0012469E1F|nr:cytochrome c [Pseudomonas sp. C27(2019)]QEY58414.1 cytochrome c [Pseudomonas sp. C27(2019)]